jgi:predicted GNAT family N-acyltransferase
LHVGSKRLLIGGIIIAAMNTLTFKVRLACWRAERDKLCAVRRIVFIEEQKVPAELEWDGADEHASHVLAIADDGEAIGTARLKADCRIGRMAVLRPWRRRGVGGSMLAALLDIAIKHGCSRVHLHAQTHALAFYARYGFIAVGDEFEEAGIAHRAMELAFKPPQDAT